MSSILLVNHLTKVYKSGTKSLTVLEDISFEIHPGSTCAIIGPSGSGKTTLLGLCAGLDAVSSGNIILANKALDNLDEDERAAVRNQAVGFVFQNFNLLPTLTALENVMVPLELLGEKEARKRSEELLEKVGLKDRMNHYASQLSGGEQQRVSIARAFSNNPKILFADEPTGNLDEETGQKIEKLLFELNREAGTTLVLVTHDNELAEKTDRVISLKGGKIVSDVQNKQASAV